MSARLIHIARIPVLLILFAALVLPTFVWFRWLGAPALDDVIRWSTFNDFSRALAIAWLVIAVATVVRQVRRSGAALPS